MFCIHFYNETKPGMVACPPPPQWKNSPELHLNGGPTAPLNENHKLDAEAAMTNDDILGDEIPFDQMKSVRESCNKMSNLNVKGHGKFPGSHPVSLNRGQFITSEAALLLCYMES